MVEFGSPERPGETEAERVQETRSPKINLNEGGNDCEGGGERRSSERVQGETYGRAKRERGECQRLQRIKNCAISKRASPAQIKLVSGHEGLAPWHHILAWPNPHHHISRPQRSREMPACIFWGEDSGTILRADVCVTSSPFTVVSSRSCADILQCAIQMCSCMT